MKNILGCIIAILVLVVICLGPSRRTAFAQSAQPAKADQKPVTTPAPPPVAQVTVHGDYRFAKSKEELKSLIKTNMEAAETMLKSKDVKIRRNGLAEALLAACNASSELKDNVLAISICERDILPNKKDLTSPGFGYFLSEDNVTEMLIAIWVRAGQTNNVIDAYKNMLAANPKGKRADLYRFRLALTLLDEKKTDTTPQSLSAVADTSEAVGYLAQIDLDNQSMAGAKALLKKLRPDMVKEEVW